MSQGGTVAMLPGGMLGPGGMLSPGGCPGGMMLGRGLRGRRMLGHALTARGALLPRDHLALRLLQRLLPALRGAVHVVGLPPPRQPPGLRHPLHPRRRLCRLPPPLPLCLPGTLRPGGLPAPHHMGTVSPWGGSRAVGPRAAPTEWPSPRPAWPLSHRQLWWVPGEGGQKLHGEAMCCASAGTVPWLAVGVLSRGGGWV